VLQNFVLVPNEFQGNFHLMNAILLKDWLSDCPWLDRGWAFTLAGCVTRI